MLVGWIIYDMNDENLFQRIVHWTVDSGHEVFSYWVPKLM